ncbi:hypothetical protein SAMN05421678_1294 [Actinopolymorpha cephalotaxi]|nr:hypothetical protein SAMN05421678_1294 [Actinopolymorpha cephalotaxi]
MGVGWIDDIYNNTDARWYLRSVDSSHNGSLAGGGTSFVLDGGAYHSLAPRTHYHADWCGIPWYYNGQHFKAMSSDMRQNVQFFTSQVDGKNWVYYTNGVTGATIARQEAPKVDFHCRLRFEADGNYLDIINDDSSTQEAVTYIYTELKTWAQMAMSALGGILKKNSGGG